MSRSRTDKSVDAGTLALPPYGYMNESWMWDIATRRVPDQFSINGRAGTPAEWRDLVERIADELADFLWPRYDQATHRWQGKAEATAMALTVADLDLMQRSLLMKLLEPAGSDPRITVTHKSMFEDEDESKPGILYPTLDPYLSNLPAEALAKLKEAIKKSAVGFGPGPLRFKEPLQRPRPYQVAFMLMRPLSLQLAKSSMSPSVPSAHCLQGLICRCAGFLAMRPQLENSRGAVDGLHQYSVDIGDRRVFAGVHYPSDNIAAWYCALVLCDHMFGEAGQVAKDFICKALPKSTVFQAITDEVNSDPKSAFSEPMRRLSAEAKRPAKRSE